MDGIKNQNDIIRYRKHYESIAILEYAHELFKKKYGELPERYEVYDNEK